jgi:hypothetical protein
MVGANLSEADLSGTFVTQEQLNTACGESVKVLDKRDPPLTIKPCPWPEAGSK